VTLSVVFSVCRGEYDLMRNCRALIGKPVVCHATNERVLLIGNPIRGSHHGQRPKRLHQRAEYMTAPDHSRKRAQTLLTKSTATLRLANRWAVAMKRGVGPICGG
jgi:hypothetical protein